MERECARTVRSSSKVSDPLFQPLIGFQEPPRIGVVPVINGDESDAIEVTNHCDDSYPGTEELPWILLDARLSRS